MEIISESFQNDSQFSLLKGVKQINPLDPFSEHSFRAHLTLMYVGDCKRIFNQNIFTKLFFCSI